MITFEINGERFEAAFKHTTAKAELQEGQRGTTEVMVIRLADGQPVVHAEAKCKAPDNFSKSLGRQIALGRALAAVAPEPPMLGLDSSLGDQEALQEWQKAVKQVRSLRKGIVRMVA